MCYAASGEKKELEDALATQRAESKKELDAASSSAATRERECANQLAALALAMGGEYSLYSFDICLVSIECHEMTFALFVFGRSCWRAGLCRRGE